MSQPATVVSCTIEKLVQGGRGLARLDGRVVLVRGAIPGETVAVALEESRKGYVEGSVVDVLSPSSERVPAPCPVYQQCGGCQMQHVAYEAQLRFKREILTETLARVGKIQLAEIPPVVPSPAPYGARSTVRFAVGRTEAGYMLGFRRQGSHALVETGGCLLVPEAIRDVAEQVHRRLGRPGMLPVSLHEVEIRRSSTTSSLLLSFHVGPASRAQAHALFVRFADLTGVVGQVVEGPEGRRWVHGQDYLEDRLGEIVFRISHRSFMQANWALAAHLARTIREWVNPAPGLRLLELFAGIGLFGLPLARAGALVTEVEANRWALADARHTARVNHIGRCRFRHAEAERFLSEAAAGTYDLVLVDPPRTGLTDAALTGLVRVAAPRLLYLSCDPATLARDLGRLTGGGYRITRIQPFDMFPQTAHLETLVELIH
ncbi:23S rRNA (uracil(1939)-C(5))-methyltransferase RlmD [Candidatus Nitrospira bockiana]